MSDAEQKAEPRIEQTPPFAYELESGGQRLRLESPTLEGLLTLIEETKWAK